MTDVMTYDIQSNVNTNEVQDFVKSQLAVHTYLTKKLIRYWLPSEQNKQEPKIGLKENPFDFFVYLLSRKKLV